MGVTETSWESWWEEGPPTGKAREHVITAFLPLVRGIAGNLKATLPSNVEFDDLVSSGVIGLISAVDRFDPSKGNNFTRYASIRVKGSMLDELRMLDWAPRSVRRDGGHLAQAREDLEVRLGRQPTDQEVADNLGIDLDRYDRLVRRVAPKRIVRFEDLGPKDGEDDRRSALNFLMDPSSPDPSEESTTKDIYEVLLQTLEQLKERHRQMITFYYFENLSLKEIAALFGVTESRVSQIHGEAIKILKKKMGR